MSVYSNLKYSFPTSAITSGTFADARIAASNVNQHATTFDDNKIVNDLSTLGLRVHTQENLSGSNTNSASFDVFQDATKITSLTNCARNSDEFVSSVYDTTSSYNFKTAGTHGQPEMRSMNSTQSSSSHTHSNAWTNDRVSRASSSYSSAHALFLNDLSQDFTIHHWNAQDSMSDGSGNTHNQNYHAFTGVFFHGDTLSPGKNPSYSGSSIFRAAGATSGQYGYINPSNYFDYVMTDAVQSAVSGDGFTDTGYAGESAQTVNVTGSTNGHFVRHYYNSGSSSDPYGVKAVNTASTNTLVISFISGAGTGSLTNGKNTITHKGTGTFHLVSGDATGTSGRYIGLSANHTADAGFGSLTTSTASATGSFEGTAITAGSSTNKMGAVITYQDNAGTNTLNTDIVLKLSADNGSNYSTATLTALPDFATGIKMAKVNDLSVTAGTQLKYKIEFANQASGSKEARIRGVSLQY
jgi:hypothetical protein